MIKQQVPFQTNGTGLIIGNQVYWLNVNPT